MGVAEDVAGGDVDDPPDAGVMRGVQHPLAAAHVGVPHRLALGLGDADLVHRTDVDDGVAALHALVNGGLVGKVASTSSQPSSRSSEALSGERTSATTSSPRSRSFRATWPPMKPVAPVTNARTARPTLDDECELRRPGMHTTPGPGSARSASSARPEQPDLSELRELLRTAEVAVAGEISQRRPEPDPDRYFGKGKLAELKRVIKEADASLVACDDELLPRQERNLEEALGVR